MASLAHLPIVAALVCLLSIHLAEGKDYKIMKTKANWFKAYQDCRLAGDRLATILSDTEQKTLMAEIQKDPQAKDVTEFWIAASDLSKEGDHRWFTTGKKIEWGHWAPNQPDNKNNEDCAAMVKAQDYKWNDCKCEHEHYFICETALMQGQVNTSNN